MNGNFSILYAFIGGALVGAVAALLFAPEKGEDLRAYIKDVLKNKGICDCDSHVDEIVEKLTVENYDK